MQFALSLFSRSFFPFCQLGRMHHDAFKVNLLLSLASSTLRDEVLQTSSSSVTPSALQPCGTRSGASQGPAQPQLGWGWCEQTAQAAIGVGSEVASSLSTTLLATRVKGTQQSRTEGRSSKEWLPGAVPEALAASSGCSRAPGLRLQRRRVLCSREPAEGQFSALLVESSAWPHSRTLPELLSQIQPYEALAKDHWGMVSLLASC